MIRFACPGCDSAYSVPDDKAGKVSRCSKCQAKFVIPTPPPELQSTGGFPVPPLPPPKPTLPPAPPAQPRPPAPPVPDANEEIEIAPCPVCQARLMVAVADLGADVECPHCQSVYVAARPSPAAPPVATLRTPPAADPDERPSRRRPRDDDEDDDRPSRRNRRRDEDEDDRPSRRGRRRDEDDDEDEDDRPSKRRPSRRRRGKSSGLLVAVAVLHFLAALLHLSCGGCFVTLGGAVAKFMGAADQNFGVDDGDFEPDPDDPEMRNPKARAEFKKEQEQFKKEMEKAREESKKSVAEAKKIGNVLLVAGIVWLITAGLMFGAGLGCANRKGYGRTLTYICAALAVLILVSGTIADLALGEKEGVGKTVARILFGLVIWGGYAAFVSWGVTKEADAFE